MNELSLTLLTPTQKLAFDLPIESLQVVAAKGELEILKDHAPLVTTLDIGILRYRQKGKPKPQKVAIFWGYLEVFENSISVLAEMAETPADIDVGRASKVLEESTQAKDPQDFEKQELRVKKAKLRLKLATEE